MVGVTGALIGSAVIGAGSSIIAGNKASKAQRRAADQQIAEQRRQYDQTRADFAPYRETGYRALDSLAGLYGVGGASAQSGGAAPQRDLSGFYASPGYQFRLSEGQKAIERSAASRGLLKSGASVKAIQRYGEGLAASEFDSYANRLASLAGVGQSSTGATAAAGQDATNNISAAYRDAGNARASSYVNTASAINTGLNNVLGAYLHSQRPPGIGGFGG